MKLKARILALCTAAVLTVTSIGLTAFARTTDNGTEPDRIRITPGGSKTLTKGRTLRLGYRITPSDTNYKDGVSWDSSNWDVADFEDDGYEIIVTAREPGTTDITVKTDNGHSDKITITVPGKLAGTDEDVNSTSSQDQDVSSRKTSTSSKAASSSKASSKTSNATGYTPENAVTLTDKMDRDTLVTTMHGVKDGTASFNNYASVSAESLQAASKEGTGKVNFSTYFTPASGGRVFLGRVTITPANAAKLTGDIKLGVYSNNEKTKKVQATFNKHYKNTAAVVKCDQGNFGMNVQITTRVGDVDSSKLKFYSYNATDNSVTPLNVTEWSVDDSGFVKFTTSVGGYIIISNGALAK